MLQYSKKETKKKIKEFMKNYGKDRANKYNSQSDSVDVFYYGTAITPEIVVNKLFRKMTVEEASDFLDNLEKRDQSVSKVQLVGGTYGYFIKYKRKRRHY